MLVSEDGAVENRILELPPGLPASALVEASNYLTAHVRGKTLADLAGEIESERSRAESELDSLTAGLVESGLASWGGQSESRQLIVRGQANLLGRPEGDRGSRAHQAAVCTISKPRRT